MASVAVASEPGPVVGGVRRVGSTLALEWREVGRPGRLATAGLLLSGLVAVVLGFAIEASVQRHLVAVRTELLQGIVDDLTKEGLLPPGRGEHASAAAVDAAIEHRLIGGEIVRVVVNDAEGMAVYGEPSDLVTSAALGRSAMPHVERHDDGLLHLVLPVEGSQGQTMGSVEVLQAAASIDEVLSRVRRQVWLSISTGLMTFGVAMGAFTVVHARTIDRRRRQAEHLLQELLRVEDRERRRIIGALHDDVGQPLYRLLYGLEGCRARLHGHDDVDEELRYLTALVRQVDGTLRAELRSLHGSGIEALDLHAALEAAARACRHECGLAITVVVTVRREPPPLVRSVLLRAVQEGLVNVRKHAHASTVGIVARGDGRLVTIEVVDDGVGPSGHPGIGLMTAAERLESVGGGLTIGSRPTGGTVLRLWAPVDAEVAP